MQPLREDDPVTLGPFTLRGRLGAGGMGVVYLAETAENVEVAVKTVPRGVGSDVRIRLQREAQLLAKIDHPRIPRFVDADAGADEPWLAMRYVSGPSLVDADLPLPPAQLRQLADGLAEALAALHRIGVTHRDVKPGNVIMTSHGAVLVDLGIAVTAEASSMTMAGTAVGSPAWMAPEQFAGDPAGPSADVWGWGAVLTYAATGHEPFGSGTIAALANRILNQPPDLNGVPDWLRGPIQAALTKRPDRRPTAADLTRGGRVRTAPPPPQAPIPGWGQPGPTVPPHGQPPQNRTHQSGPQPVPPHISGPHGMPPHQSGPQPVPHHSGPYPLASTSGQQPIGRPAGKGHRAPRQRTGSTLVWLMTAGALLVVAVVAVALFATLGGGGGGGGGTGTPTGSGGPTGGTAIGSNDITESLLKQDGVCTADCTITGKVPFTHPNWGKSTLVTTQASKSGSTPGQANLAVIDSTGASKWHYVVSSTRTLAPITSPSNPVDKTGHIFLTYNPGRYDGIIVLATADLDAGGMTDFGSVPTIGTDASAGRFYDAKVSDVSGTYQIVVESNDCNPDCAGGKLTHTTYKWNGIDNYAT